MTQDERFMKEAIQLSRQALEILIGYFGKN